MQVSSLSAAFLPRVRRSFSGSAGRGEQRRAAAAQYAYESQSGDARSLPVCLGCQGVCVSRGIARCSCGSDPVAEPGAHGSV